MPDPRLSSGSEFDRYRGRISVWLRDKMSHVRSLTRLEIRKYDGKGIVVGWRIQCSYLDHALYVLLDHSFPYSAIHIAYEGEDRYLEWPHVEEYGYLCLPENDWFPIEDPEASIKERIKQAKELLEQLKSDKFIQSESAREFLTYWSRNSNKRAFCLLNITNTVTRKVAGKSTGNGFVVGETEDEVQAWLENIGRDHNARSVQAVFGFIDTPPSLPPPRSNREFLNSVASQCVGLDAIIDDLSPFNDTLIILAAEMREGIGIIGAHMHRIPTRGFRKRKGGEPRHTNSTRSLWQSYFNKFTSVRMSRVDGGWVHGRDQSEYHDELSRKSVIVLGAGSLGSQVASRLAQAGVGHIPIVDPDNLEPSNIGRHALGMESVGGRKSSRLAQILSQKYPHGRYRGIPHEWQVALRRHRELFDNADLVVCCIGDPEEELAWDAWHRSGCLKAPTLYGWIGTEGTSGHALACTFDGPGLCCVIEPDGLLRRPDTDFLGDTRIKTEPGCGTEFQPYGPLAAGQVELLVTRLGLDLLSGKVEPPHHRIFACSTEDLEELGGRWTEEHYEYRPEGYDGPFECSIAVDECGRCHQCLSL